MAINRISMTADSLLTNTDATIEIRSTQPRHLMELDPPETPHKLIGYYNAAIGYVELFVVNSDGTKILRI